MIELPVAGVEDAAGGRLDRDADRVRDRVRHAHELEPEGPELHRFGLGIDLAELGRPEQAVLVELRLDEPERQPRGPDLLDLDLAHQERQRADVVLVRVRQHDGAHGASRRYPKSGRITSTPRCSSRGNDMPASTTIRSPAASYTVMFLPTSPRPPSGITRSTSAIWPRSVGARPRVFGPVRSECDQDQVSFYQERARPRPSVPPTRRRHNSSASG